ncbi:uncharacterized protein [Argopecten irradians]|uniref:uncharacterized protein n=1 Tax=Argopecten irradians TaxID=31199 RepID=UPI00371F21E4
MPGRGRGIRGRRGRGRGWGRHGRAPREAEKTPKEEVEIATAPEDLDVNKNASSFFMGNVTFDQHYKGQEANRDRYAAAMEAMVKNGVEIPMNARARSLAAAWARNDRELSESLLSLRGTFGLVEVLKAVTLLDAGRCARTVEKRLRQLQIQKTPIKGKTIGKLKSNLDNLLALKTTAGSATGSVSKAVKKWVQTLTADELEFYALHFPTEPWKKLADICHFNPKKDFHMLPWFLPFCFGAEAPEGSLALHCRNVTEENVNDLLKEYAIPYSHIKPLTKKLTDESKGRVADKEVKLDTALWYYEDLQCKEVDQAIQARLDAGHKVTLATGKLMERMLILRMMREGMNLESMDDTIFNWDWERFPDGPGNVERTPDHSKASFFPSLQLHAEKRLQDISLPLEAPIVVMGDASGSMEVAIRTSSIIAGILTAVTSAKLVFFDDFNREAPFLPKTVEEILNLAVSTKTGGGTTPAASLYPFYKNKETVKTFIVVTDEEENGEVEVQEDGELKNYSFCQVFKRYHEEVYPAKLVFVSFLHQTQDGQMVSELHEAGFNPLQYKFDRDRPDLSKLDRMFGLIATETSSFDEEMDLMEKAIKSDGLRKAFGKLMQNES